MAWLGLAQARAAGRSVCLGARPRGVAHLCESPKRPGGRLRPVCGQRARRLYPHGHALFPPGAGPVREPARPLCRRCSARAGLWAGPARAEQLPHAMPAGELAAAAAAVTTDAQYWDALAWVLTATPRPAMPDLLRVFWAPALADLMAVPVVLPTRRPRWAPVPPLTRPVVVPPAALVAFEGYRWRHSGAKEYAVRQLFGCSATRYHQSLNTALDTPEALEQDPVLVHRLRRRRDAARLARSAS